MHPDGAVDQQIKCVKANFRGISMGGDLGADNLSPVYLQYCGGDPLLQPKIFHDSFEDRGDQCWGKSLRHGIDVIIAPRSSQCERGSFEQNIMAVEKENDSVVVNNRKAFHDYFIEETFEAGLALFGTEVKSLREGRINLKDSYAMVENGEVFLYNCHISPYSHGNLSNHDPTRRRKLLLRKGEIQRLFGKVQQKGFTLVPLKIYFKRGWAKVELGLALGKKLYDKRETESKKSAQREIEKGLRGKGR